MVEKSILTGYGVGSLHCPEMDAQSWVPQKWHSVGHTDGEMGWRVEGLDTIYDANTNSQGRRHLEPARVDETTGGQAEGVRRIRADKETKEICLPLTLEHRSPESHRHWRSKGTIKRL